MIRKRTMILAIAAVAAIAYAWLFQVRQGVERSQEAHPTSVARQVTENLNEEVALRRELPPVDQELRLTITELRKRSADGDASATCRLAVEYGRCSLVQKRVERIDNSSGSAGNSPLQFNLPTVADSMNVDLAHCDTVEAPGPEEIAKLWRVAAEQGSVPAMTNYAVGNGFSMDALLDVADELKTYRKQGPEFARRSIAAGDGRALLSLAAAYSPEGQNVPRTLLAQAVGLNVSESLTLYKVARLRLASGGSASPELSKYVDEQIAKLDSFATSEQRFDSDRQASARASQSPGLEFPPSPLASLRRGRIAEIRPSECSEIQR